MLLTDRELSKYEGYEVRKVNNIGLIGYTLFTLKGKGILSLNRDIKIPYTMAKTEGYTTFFQQSAEAIELNNQLRRYYHADYIRDTEADQIEEFWAKVLDTSIEAEMQGQYNQYKAGNINLYVLTETQMRELLGR